jgi:HNH endonuclease
MNAALDRLVWQRAKWWCEYCQLPQAFSPLPHAIDHIIARQHHGPTQADNLALACFFCNSYKGPNISGLNPRTGRRVRLFNPRKDRWAGHFQWRGPVLTGRTHTGSVTIALLEINRFEAVDFREYLIREGAFPPDR